MLEKLKEFLEALRLLRKDIKAEKVKRIAKKDLRTRAEQLGSRWFSEFSTPLLGDHPKPAISDHFKTGQR